MINTENYREEIREITEANTHIIDKSILLKQLLERLCKELTNQEAMQFPNLFSRLVFVAQKYDLPKQTEWQLQNFRVKVTEYHKERKELNQKTFNQAERAILDLCTLVSNDEVDKKRSDALTSTTTILTEPNQKDFAKLKPKGREENKLRVQILSIDRDKSLIVCAVESSPKTQLTVKYNVSPDNIAFNE